MLGFLLVGGCIGDSVAIPAEGRRALLFYAGLFEVNKFRSFLLYLPLPRELLGHWCEKPPECTQSMLVKPL